MLETRSDEAALRSKKDRLAGPQGVLARIAYLYDPFRRVDLHYAGQLWEMKTSLFFLNVPFILVSHTHGAMITNGTHNFHLVSALCGQRLRSLGVGTSFPFPHLSPINAHPQASFESNPNRGNDRLVRAPFEVSDNGVSSRVMGVPR